MFSSLVTDTRCLDQAQTRPGNIEILSYQETNDIVGSTREVLQAPTECCNNLMGG